MKTIAYFLGTHEDWGGASRALLNFIRRIDRSEFRPLVFLTKPGTLSDALVAEGISVIIEPKLAKESSKFDVLRAILRVRRRLKKERVDLVHLNYASVEWKPPAVLAAKSLRIPVVYHYHSEIKTPSPYVRFADTVIVVSGYIARSANALGRPVEVIHNIVDISRFSAGSDIRATLNIPQSSTVVAFAGQIKRIKGIETLLRAMAAVTDTNAHLLIAGEHRPSDNEITREEFDEAIARDHRCQYIGYRKDIENIYQTADIMVMPSLYDEPCAMVLFEAAAARKPIIASNTGGTPEIISDGVNGLLFARDNHEELANCLRRLLADATLRREMGQRANDMALTNFCEVPVQKLQALYTRLLAS